MKKTIAMMLALLLTVVTFSFAEMDGVVAPAGTPQLPTEVNVNYNGQSNFESLGAWGNSSTGNPGYLVLKGCDDMNACFPYYLWVDNTGDLVMASYATIVAFASFPTGNWNNTNGFKPGTVIGGQS